MGVCERQSTKRRGAIEHHCSAGKVLVTLDRDSVWYAKCDGRRLKANNSLAAVAVGVVRNGLGDENSAVDNRIPHVDVVTSVDGTIRA